MDVIELEVFSDFGQIQVFDGDFDPCESDAELDWDDDAISKFGCYCPQVVALGVIENDDHKIPLSIHDTAPEAEIEKWDHIVEFPFECLSGSVDIAEESIALPKGKYALRWSVKKVGESGEYRIEFIKSDLADINVIKQQSNIFS